MKGLSNYPFILSKIKLVKEYLALLLFSYLVKKKKKQNNKLLTKSNLKIKLNTIVTFVVNKIVFLQLKLYNYLKSH